MQLGRAAQAHPLLGRAGHTLRLLQFPTTLEKGLAKLMSLKESFGGIANQMTRMLGAPGTEDLADQLLGKLDQLKVCGRVLVSLGAW